MAVLECHILFCGFRWLRVIWEMEIHMEKQKYLPFAFSFLLTCTWQQLPKVHLSVPLQGLCFN